jgi:hypothetical protein
MRRLRAGFAALHSGGRGSPSGPTTGLCHSVAGRVRVRRAKAGRMADDLRRASRAGRPYAQYPEVRSPGQKSRGGALTGAAIRREADRVPATTPAPVGAPPPLVVSRGDFSQNSGSPGRENAEAWLFDMRIGFRERSCRRGSRARLTVCL